MFRRSQSRPRSRAARFFSLGRLTQRGSSVDRLLSHKLGARPLSLEALEDRRMLAVVWTNRGTTGSDTDSFDAVYAGLADAARQNIDRAIANWNAVILDFNYDGDNNAATNNVFPINVVAADLGGGTRGQGGPTGTDGNGLPTGGTLTMDDGGGAGGWFIDATAFADDEFQFIVNAFQSGSSQAGNDFFRTAVHEIGHAVGILTGGALAINFFLTGAGTDQVSNADDLNVFQNLGGQFGIPITMTDNGGGHIYEGPVDPGFPGAPVHPNELMNPGRTVGPPATRQMVTDLNAMLLADAYGYRVQLPSLTDFKFIAEDPLEDNNTLQTATVLGSLEKVTINDVSIFDTGDVDFYRYTAPNTGRLDIRAFFADGGDNDIDIQVLDVDGTNFTPAGQGASIDNDEQIVVPVVAGQTYFIRVFAPLGAVQNYDLEVENYKAPVPSRVFLHPLDDTGVFNNDNVTTDTTPRFFIEADLLAFALAGIPIDPALTDPGADVELQIVGANTGTIAAINATRVNQSLWSAAVTSALPPDLYFVQAATWIRDGATPLATGRGQLSTPLFLTIEADRPPISFGLPGGVDGLQASSDTGVATAPATFSDRITSDSTPTLYGRAEAGSTVRLYADVNNNNAVDIGVDLFLGQTTATPFGQNPLFTDGYWQIDSAVDLNNPAFFPTRDGLRRLLATAEDFVGNVNQVNDGVGDADQVLEIFLDTQGPRISGVTVAGLPNLFDPKPSVNGTTPLVNRITISVTDLPARLAPNFLYNAIQADIADSPGNYLLVGDAGGVIPIQDVVVTLAPPVNGQPATATIELVFAAPLPDDRYTLTILDAIVDPAGNNLDGESNADEPQGNPQFPSGDGLPGGPFIGRFTVDSRPEIAAFVPQQINIDANGNFVWDPASAPSGDAAHVDLTFLMQLRNAAGVQPGGFGVQDLVFAGRFFIPAANGLPAANRFDQLAVYGNSQELASQRWLIDLNSDGVVNTAIGEIRTLQPTGGLPGNFNVVSAVPVAGNFDNNAANGDEIGLFNAGRWALDSNRNFVIDAADTFITTTLTGHPIVGDFDGDGRDDLAAFNNNVFSFNLANDGLVDATDATLTWGFPGVLDRPVATDIDRDGIDDIGLWVPRDNAQVPVAIAEWYFLLSNNFSAPGVPDAPTTGTIARLNHPFTPVPFGFDLYAEFGNETALPLVGNFDPPVAGELAPQLNIPTADFDGDQNVDGNDFLSWQRGVGKPDATANDGDANDDDTVDENDRLLWQLLFGEATSALAGSTQSEGDGAPAAEFAAATSATHDELAATGAESVFGDASTASHEQAYDAFYAGGDFTQLFAPAETPAGRRGWRPMRRAAFSS